MYLNSYEITKFPDLSKMKKLKILNIKGNALTKLDIIEIQKQLPHTKIIFKEWN